MPAHVLFDGDCALCRKSVALLKKLDWRHELDFISIREASHPFLQNLGVPPERLLQEMHLVPPGAKHIYHGFAAFRWMAWRLPPLWPLAPFLYIPGVPTLGQRFYLWIARNRFRLVPCHGGVCTIERKEDGDNRMNG